MRIMIFILIGILWLAAAIATWRIVSNRDDAAFEDAVCGLLFWWIILPIASVVFAFGAGRDYTEQFIAWRKEQRVKRVLKSGTENGLYE